MKKSIRIKRILMIQLAGVLNSLGGLNGLEFGIFRKRNLDYLRERMKSVSDETVVTPKEIGALISSIQSNDDVVGRMAELKKVYEKEEDCELFTIAKDDLPKDISAGALEAIFDLVEFPNERTEEN